MKNILLKLMDKEDLSFDEISYIVNNIAYNETSDSQIAAFLVAITAKGVSKEEFYGFALAMRKFAVQVKTDKYVVDACGTGADMSKSINISTSASIVANACNVNVIKQTNSCITSDCGSTDFLSALGIEITKSADKALENFYKNNICFVHSPYFNNFAKVNNPIRKQIGIKTIFNYLGPLINPSFPNAQLLGVSSEDMCDKIAYALLKLGTDRALIVNGLNPNLDEISICSETRVLELRNGELSEYILTPEQFGFVRADLKEIQGGNGIKNARLITEIFNGTRNGAMKDIISLNAGAMIYLSGISPTIEAGVKTAQEAIENGSALRKILCLQSFGAENVKFIKSF